MSAIPKYDAEEIRFDIVKEVRQSTCDSRELICIDVDRVGDGYRAIVNGYEITLPSWVGTMTDAKQIALEAATKIISEALAEIVK